MSLYKSAVGRPVTTMLVFVAVAILGLFSWSRLPVDLLPEIETNAIMVMTTYRGASAADIETNVTRPLENILNGVSDLKHVNSSSKENISIITLEFEYGIDIVVAPNDVRDKLDMVVSALPDEADTLYVGNSYPLHTGASARILLANMPEEDRLEYIDSLFIERSAKEELLEDMRRIRERGYDYTEQMMTKGIWGISVPIFDVRGKLIGGISTGDHIENNSPEYIQERLDQLKQLAVQIQEAMNGL